MAALFKCNLASVVQVAGFFLLLSYFLAFVRVCALWSPAGKGLTSWLSFVVSNCEYVAVSFVSWVRCGTWLYRFLIFAPLHWFCVSFWQCCGMVSDRRLWHFQVILNHSVCVFLYWVLILLCSTLSPFWFYNHPAGEEIFGYLNLIVSWRSYRCNRTLPLPPRAMSCSVMCHSGISLSYSLFSIRNDFL